MGVSFYKCLRGRNIESKTADFVVVAMPGVRDTSKVRPAGRSCTFD